LLRLVLLDHVVVEFLTSFYGGVLRKHSDVRVQVIAKDLQSGQVCCLLVHEAEDFKSEFFAVLDQVEYSRWADQLGNLVSTGLLKQRYIDPSRFKTQLKVAVLHLIAHEI